MMTCRVPAGELLGLTGSGSPFFRAGWGHNGAGALLGDHTDWTEIVELLTDSYCEMAPTFLIARVSPRRPNQLIRRTDDKNVDGRLVIGSPIRITFARSTTTMATTSP